MSVRLDHLVVAAQTLEEGVAWCEATLGIAPGPGGRHPLMGTHNRLFSIASAAFPKAYLEIIAIDPAACALGRARWFGLDTAALHATPRLLHFVVRTPDIRAACRRLAAMGEDVGTPGAASRATPQGELHWQISVRDDGGLPHGGALP
ncbi:MAG: VOC family protein, partial [Methylibium sp.]|nr:VOC family protein [Methylibium sp.]